MTVECIEFEKAASRKLKCWEGADEVCLHGTDVEWSPSPTSSIIMEWQGGEGLFTVAEVTLKDNPLREQFGSLVKKFERETALEASLAKIIINPAYQQIIAMGSIAIPLILEQLQGKLGHWFWALRVLAFAQGDTDPAEGATTLPEARQAWLRWGERKGYL